MQQYPIGIMDSGSGGLTIWQTLVRILPLESTIYVGDHANLPYGSKAANFIRGRVVKIIEYLRERKAKLIVIACNTATVAGIEFYREKFPGLPIVGVVPVVKTAALESRKGCFGVLSTGFTATSHYQKELIKKYSQGQEVFNLGTNKLVPLIEKGILKGLAIESELKKIFTPEIRAKIDVLALGSTHYPWLRPVIRKILGPRVKLLDSAGAVSRQTARILGMRGDLAGSNKPTYQFLTTGNSGPVSSLFTSLLQKKTKVATIKL